MTVFRYDKTFEGLLTCIFEAYMRRTFPQQLFGTEEPLPLFIDDVFTVFTDTRKAERVWKSLKQKLSAAALTQVTACWLADGRPHTDELLFRYMRKVVDATKSIELNFADADVIELSKVYKQISGERLRMLQFVRFQKAADDIYFAAFEPLHNVLPLAVAHFQDRFADQKWLIYDIKRAYGFFYDLQTVTEVTFQEGIEALDKGFLTESAMAADEQLFQQLWQTYFKSICIEARINPRKHRQDMPVRYWKYLVEKRLSIKL